MLNVHVHIFCLITTHYSHPVDNTLIQFCVVHIFPKKKKNLFALSMSLTISFPKCIEMIANASHFELKNSRRMSTI